MKNRRELSEHEKVEQEALKAYERIVGVPCPAQHRAKYLQAARELGAVYLGAALRDHKKRYGLDPWRLPNVNVIIGTARALKRRCER